MVTRVQDAMHAAAVVHAMGMYSSHRAEADATSYNYGEDSTQMSVQDNVVNAQIQQVVNAQAAKSDSVAQQEETSTERLDENQVSLLTKELNEIMSRITANLSFEYHKEVNVLSVRMLDRKTGETLKELPPEKMIENLKRTREWIGAFIDEHV